MDGAFVVGPLEPARSGVLWVGPPDHEVGLEQSESGQRGSGTASAVGSLRGVIAIIQGPSTDDLGRMRAKPESGFDLSRSVRRVVILAFAVIQLVLVARILLDLGVVPGEGRLGELIMTSSDVLAAPVRRVGSMFGGVFGTPPGGSGLNVAMLVALGGWSIVEGLVMRVVRKFDEI